MLFRALARLFALLHTVFAIFVAAGGLLTLRHPRAAWVHLAAVTWAVLTMTTDLGCVLTSWEKSLWRRGGREPYPEGFIEHHLLRRRLPVDSAHRYHVALGAVALVVNAMIYAAALHHAR
jgi:Protein of Unknown function (DUF2784)